MPDTQVKGPDPDAGFEGCICFQDEHHDNCPAIPLGKCHYQSLYRNLRIGTPDTALGVDKDDYKPTIPEHGDIISHALTVDPPYRSKGYDAAAVQPRPTGNGIDVAVVAASELRNLGYGKIAEDIEARIRMGEKKYGTRLKARNGRDAVLDLYQEILDAINYATQCEIEGIDDGTLFDRVVDIAVDVAGLMADRAAA